MRHLFELECDKSAGLTQGASLDFAAAQVNTECVTLCSVQDAQYRLRDAGYVPLCKTMLPV